MLDVKTRRNLSQHKSSCRDTDYCKLEKAIEIMYEEVLSRQGNECCDTKI